MNDISDILKLDLEVSEIFEVYSQFIKNTHIINDFPFTIKLLQNLDISINSLKDGILDSIKNDNLFALNILLRSQIEHFITFHYIYIRFFQEKNDKRAEEYIDNSLLWEELEELYAKETAKEILDNSYEKKKRNDIITSNNAFSKFKSQDELKTLLKDYEYKKMIAEICKIYKEEKGEKITFFGDIIILYSQLSSFVHGGIKSIQEMIIYKNDQERKSYYLNRAKLSCQISITLKYYILYLICTHRDDKEIFEVCLNEIGKKLDTLSNYARHKPT